MIEPLKITPFSLAQRFIGLKEVEGKVANSAILAMRFWKMVDRSGECWNWVGFRRNGYGGIYENKRFFYAHRLSWELHEGPIPEGRSVLHHCDNPTCVYPGHLFLGTHRDNMVDMATKGRGAKKLTAEDAYRIRTIYALGGFTMKQIAATFGISPGCVWQVTSGKTWSRACLPS